MKRPLLKEGNDEPQADVERPVMPEEPQEGVEAASQALFGKA